jgi:hypothetical protein
VANTRSATLGPSARPVAVPFDLEQGPKAEGVVRLPAHIRWSGPELTYDLDDPADRARVYEQVLREGTEEDVRLYVRPDRLLEHWGTMVLPAYVRVAWAESIRRLRRQP